MIKQYFSKNKISDICVEYEYEYEDIELDQTLTNLDKHHFFDKNHISCKNDNCLRKELESIISNNILKINSNLSYEEYKLYEQSEIVKWLKDKSKIFDILYICYLAWSYKGYIFYGQGEGHEYEEFIDTPSLNLYINRLVDDEIHILIDMIHTTSYANYDTSVKTE